jgi:hypothetical protein
VVWNTFPYQINKLSWVSVQKIHHYSVSFKPHFKIDFVLVFFCFFFLKLYYFQTGSYNFARIKLSSADKELYHTYFEYKLYSSMKTCCDCNHGAILNSWCYPESQMGFILKDNRSIRHQKLNYRHSNVTGLNFKFDDNVNIWL